MEILGFGFVVQPFVFIVGKIMPKHLDLQPHQESQPLRYNYVEMARVTGTPINFLLNRGQMIKVQISGRI